MITVIIPTLNEERRLPRTLAALVPAMVDGAIKRVIIVDGGSTDRTRELADDAGADVIHDGTTGRGRQLAAGAAGAETPWMLFLHADTALQPGWHEEAARFIAAIDRKENPDSAAAFTFALDDQSFKARLITLGVHIRCRGLKLPYGDQGLLISKRLYDAVGGMQPLPLLEDVDLVRRLGRKRMTLLNSKAITSADRYRKTGYARRVLRNWWCLASFYLGVPVERIVARYNR
ncbi:MAG: hypothetical protein RL291_1508 [Pseudomonadota bacterium]|jgi:rSAM/selenodomain-associated transferase 2